MQGYGCVLASARAWQRLCVLQDKVARCLLRCRSARGSCGLAAPHMDMSPQALAAELLNARSWDPAQHPAWLAFEVTHGLEIRERQYRVARKLLDQPGERGSTPEEREPGALLQLNMGEGKTRVILPMLALELAGRGHAVRLAFLSELLHEAFSFLHRTLTGSDSARKIASMWLLMWFQTYVAMSWPVDHKVSLHYCKANLLSWRSACRVRMFRYAGSLLGVRCLLQPFSRSINLDMDKIAAMEQQLLQCRSHRAVLCIASEERLSLELKGQVHAVNVNNVVISCEQLDSDPANGLEFQMPTTSLL
jgi:Protein of unknown function (DUF3638)